MGSGFTEEITNIYNEEQLVYTVNMSTDFKNVFDQYNEVNVENKINLKFIEKNDIDTTNQQNLTTLSAAAVIVFEEDIDIKINNYLTNISKELPTIKIYFDETITESSAAHQKILTILEYYRLIKFTQNNIPTNIVNVESNNYATEEDQSKQLMSMLLPMMIMIFIFAGGIAVGADSIAGEKERGTISTLLMAPINKKDIILGKSISTVIITILSAIGSFLGLALSMPNAEDIYGVSSIGGYSFITYIQLLIIIILIGLLASGIFLIASTIAKTTKEATSYAMPAYIIAMAISVTTMFETTIPQTFIPYIIPLYNLSLGLKGIFLNILMPYQFILIIVSTLIYFVLLIIFTVKLFKNENLMFSK
jgi:sodium transport system permease protein